MHELEKAKKTLEAEKSEIQTALEEAEVQQHQDSQKTSSSQLFSVGNQTNILSMMKSIGS